MTKPNRPAAPSSFALSDEFIEEYVALSPIRATYLGIPGHDDRWDDTSLEGATRRVALYEKYRNRRQAETRPTERWARLADRILGDHLDEGLEWYAHGEHFLDLNNIESTLQTLRQVFDVMNTTSAAAWGNIAARLETFDRACAGYRATLEEGRRNGRVVSKRQVRAAIDQARVSAGETSFFLTLPRALEASGVGDEALRKRLAAAVEHTRATFGNLADYFEKTYLPSATERDAAGRERYLRAARRFLGMTIDPVETYAWGWSQVHEIEARMARIADGIQAGATVPEVIEILTADPARCAKDVDEFLAIMRKRQERALADLDGTHFDIPEPARRIEVKITPPGGALGAYYIPPSEDFTRPGTVWYSPGRKTMMPLYDEISTAYHEGFPGHHLQCAIQVHLADRLSRLHRLIVWYPGHGEGWALYAEQLMHELGYFEKPEYVLGMLAAKLMRACRVVVDIGMHLEQAIPKDEAFHPGEVWNYDLAVEFMNRRAFLPIENAKSEVTRYLGWPGQAIAYKVGERVILELREELKRRKGSAFDLKDFHARVVGSGSVGLDHLRELVLGD